MTNRQGCSNGIWLTLLALLCWWCALRPVAAAEKQPTAYVVIQDQATVVFYQAGKPTGAETLPKGTFIQADSVSADMVLTTYKGKTAYIQLQYLTIAESNLIVAADHVELFYLQDGKPAGLEQLARGTKISVETRSGDQVFTTYNGKPAYLRSQSLITPREFAVTLEHEASAVRAQAAKALAEKMEHDITRLRALRLDPKRSRSVADYDSSITGEFRKFLAAYPGSPYETEVNERIKEWQAERDQVAAGMIKDSGEWMTKVDFDQSRRTEQVSTLLRAAEESFTQMNWPIAARKYNAALALGIEGGTEIVAKQQLAASLKSWRKMLEQSQGQLSQGQKKNEDELLQSQSALRAAQKGYAQVIAAHATAKPTLESGGPVMQAQQAVNHAENQLAQAKLAQSKAHAEAESLQRQLSDITQIWNQNRLQEEREKTAAPVPVEPPSGTAGWLQQNWLIVAVVGLVGLVVFFRLLR